MLPDFIIDEILKRKRKNDGLREVVEQLRIEIPQGHLYNNPKSDDEDRGVYEIEIIAGNKSYTAN